VIHQCPVCKSSSIKELEKSNNYTCFRCKKCKIVWSEKNEKLKI